MSHINVTIIGNEDMYGRNAVALGITHILSNNYSTTIFRPCAQTNDAFTKQLLGIANTSAKLEQVIASTPEILLQDTMKYYNQHPPKLLLLFQATQALYMIQIYLLLTQLLQQT